MTSDNKKPLFQLPIPSTEFEGDARLCGDTLHFQYFQDGRLVKSGIKFNKIAASRTRSERCSTAWHIDGVYDTLAEVDSSSWLEQIHTDTQSIWRDKWKMRHLMIYVDTAGCFEIIAESWEFLPAEVIPILST